MRLLSLDGQQVGHWNSPIHLKLSPRLTVVLGDNEAGKSTLRRAIKALLFGPDKELAAPVTVAAFNMAAQLEHEGEIATLHRRGKKLEAAIPDGVARLLADANSARFRSLFDLAHDNLLPHDSAGFLSADGVLGSLMFGAVTGVSPVQLQHARQQIEKMLKDINSGRAGSYEIPYWQERYKEALRRHRDLVRFGQSDAAQKEHDRLDGEVRLLDEALAALDERRRHLDDLLCSIEDADQLVQERKQLGVIVGEGQPPARSVVAVLLQQFQRVQDRANDVQAAQESLDEATAALDAAEAPGGLNALSPQIEGMREDVAACTADREQRHQLQSRHGQKLHELGQLLERMGAAPDEAPEAAARALLRPESLVAQLEALLSEQELLQTGLQQAQALLAAAQRTQEQANSGPDDGKDNAIDLLDAVRTRLDDACRAEDAIDRLNAERAEAAPLLRRQLGALQLLADADPADGLHLPSGTAARTAENALKSALAELETCNAQFAQIQADARELQQKLDVQRRQVHSVASAEDVERSRSLRDSRLQRLCEVLDAGDASKLPELSEQAAELRQLVRQSDLLVDSRMEAGERLGQLRSDEQQEASLKGRIAEARCDKDRAEQMLIERKRALAGLWPFLREPPDSADNWFRLHEEWRAAWENDQKRLVELARFSDALATARQDVLGTLGRQWPQFGELASAKALSDAVGREREQRGLRAAQAEERLRQKLVAESNVRKAQGDVESAERALAEWQHRWDADTRELPEGLERRPESVRRWLKLQEDLRRVLGEVAQLAEDVAARSRNIDAKEHRIGALLDESGALDPALVIPAGMDPVSAFRLIDEACRISVGRLDKQRSLAGKRDQSIREQIRANQKFQEASAALVRSWNEAGRDDDCTREALDEMEQRSVVFQALREQIADRENRLRGRFADAMEDAVNNIQRSGRPKLQAELEDVVAQLDQARKSRESTADARRDAWTAIEAMQYGRDATRVGQELADAREGLFDKLEERYRLQLARLLLDHAYDEASKGGRDLEQLGSRYFHTLTGGAYLGLRIDHDTPGEPMLMAVESARDEKSLAKLSVGTRDQVWLALRLAGIMGAAKDTPFPLLLDDSLVQFDDIRAEAALRLLHEISEHVQVILFTHHDHVASLAEAALPEEDLALVVLPAVTGEMRARTRGVLAGARRERPVAGIGENHAIDIESHFKRNEGRPGRSGEENSDQEQAKTLFMRVLQGVPAPIGKDAILSAGRSLQPGFDLEKHWLEVVRALQADGKIVREGAKRGTKYRIAELAASAFLNGDAE